MTNHTMSFAWEHSSAYRALVRVTARSRVAMGVFTLAALVAVPAVLTAGAMETTNNAALEATKREVLLRRRAQTLDSRVIGEGNKARLGELLRAARDGGVEGEAAYAKALGVKKRE